MRKVLCLLLSVPLSILVSANSGELYQGTNEGFIHICDEWYHTPEHTLNFSEEMTRLESGIDKSENLLITYYIGCDFKLYAATYKVIKRK